MFLFEQDLRTFFLGGEIILFLFNLERRAEQGKEMVFIMIDSCLGAESQSFPLALCVCQAFLYWEWVVLTFGVPRGLALCLAHRHSAKAS